MAISGVFVSTVVMGVLLVGAAVAVSRFRGRPDYTPTFRPSGERASTLPGTDVASDTVAFAAAVAIVVLVAITVYLDAASVLLVAVAASLLAAFFAWGFYSLGRSRGLPRAHSIALSAWLFAVVLVGVVAAKLLLG